MSKHIIGRTQTGRPVYSNMKPGRKATRTLNQHKQKLIPSTQRGKVTRPVKPPKNIRTVGGSRAQQVKANKSRVLQGRKPKPIYRTTGSRTPHAALRKSDFRRGFVRSGKNGQVVRIGSLRSKGPYYVRAARSPRIYGANTNTFRTNSAFF